MGGISVIQNELCGLFLKLVWALHDDKELLYHQKFSVCNSTSVVMNHKPHHC